MNEYFPENNGILREDEAPFHTAKHVMNYLHSHNVRVLEWPGSSSYMNPVENIWKEMKDHVSRTFYTTKQQLTGRLLQVWHHDHRLIQLVQREIESMPWHIQALMNAKGGRTNY
jgi:transposase